MYKPLLLIGLAAVLTAVISLTACADMRGRDIGTITGAGVGAAVGSQLTGTPAIGAVIGAVAGGAGGRVIGKSMENKK